MTTLNDLDAIGGAAAKLWTSGETVAQWDYRKSPLDGETYQRKTASGGGATDPADDTTNYVAKTFRRVTALPGTPIGPISVGGTASNVFAIGSTKPALPSISAGVRTQVLSLTGRGSMGFLGLSTGSSGNVRFEVFVDGRSVLDTTTSWPGTSNTCAVYFGSAASGKYLGTDVMLTTLVPDAAGLAFRRTLQVFLTPVNAITASSAEFLAYQMRSES